jgi:hypothetical protein
VIGAGAIKSAKEREEGAQVRGHLNAVLVIGWPS